MTSKRSAKRAGAADREAWAILDSLPAIVLRLGADGAIAYANSMAAELLGEAGPVLGRRLDEVFGAHSPLSAIARRAMDGQRVSQADVRVGHSHAAPERFDALAAPEDGAGGVILVLTPRQTSVGGEAARGAPPLARTLAHEVRNPLAGIRAAAQLIGKTASPDTRALTDLICSETDRIRRLTDSLDALEALEPPELERVNIHVALDRARAVIAAGHPKIQVREAYDPSLPEVLGDVDQLIQVFLNLAKNAAEALEGQTSAAITLATRYRAGVRIGSGGALPRPLLEASVIDNGPGIPAEISRRLFEPFVSGRPHGAGLGLAIAAEIVSRHDGRIEVDSRPGKTVFKVLLPIPESVTP